MKYFHIERGKETEIKSLFAWAFVIHVLRKITVIYHVATKATIASLLKSP